MFVCVHMCVLMSVCLYVCMSVRAHAAHGVDNRLKLDQLEEQ